MRLTTLGDQLDEVSRQYATDHGFTRDSTWFLLKLHEEVGELTQVFLARAGQAKSKGRSAGDLDRELANELADVLAHTLLMARAVGVDLDDAVDRKWLAWTRPPAKPNT